MADEDDQWLYGDSNPEAIVTKNANANEEFQENDSEVPSDTAELGKQTQPEENGEGEPVKEEEDGTGQGDGDEEMPTKEGEKEGEDQEEDDDDSEDDNVNVVIGDISKAIPTYTSLNVHKRGGMVPASKGGAGKFSIEEFETVGVISNTSAIDFNMETLEDKPWRKPGADITDYFNYGFNEDTWKAYCERQRRIRMNESGAGLPTSHNPPPSIPQSIPSQSINTPPPVQRPPAVGQIHVVASRRVDEIQTLPPMGVPPPNFRSIPPPGPAPGYDPSYYPDYGNTYDGWRDGWPPTNVISTSHPKRMDENDDSYDRRRSPGRDRERDRERERDRDRDRERERDRERDRDRDRERERDEREREERERRDRHRSRSISHARERSRMRSRSRSPSHKKHKKKSKKSEKSDKKKRSDESE